MSEMTVRMPGISTQSGLRLTTTVPSEFVHRAAVAEVLLTGWQRVDGCRFTVTAQWPRLHGFFRPVGGRHDPMLTAETIRQAGSLLSHAEFGTPLGHQFLMRDLSFTVDPEHLDVGGVPASLELDVTCFEIRRRGGELASMRYEAVVHRDGQIVATGGASFACASPTVYRRLRGDRAAARSDESCLPVGPAVPPDEAGRSAEFDVVLSPTPEPQVWRLRGDTGHPVLFDHPVDHIPGMLLLEAARQAAHATLDSADCVLTSFTSGFTRYAELDLPCRVEAQLLPDDFAGLTSVRVTAHQDNEEVFNCIVSARKHG